MKVLLVHILCCFKYIQTQYLPVNRKPVKSPCDTTTKSPLVERFFNMIFTEFQSSPPVCVCVQMCVNQATYCYPNGCLKRSDKREFERPVSLIENAQSSIFLIDQNNEGTKDLFTPGFDSGSVAKTEAPQAIPVKERIFRPDLFKDKYKLLFQYKKMPKVELRYNLREQVKNTKSDVLRSSVDVSHTRWPQTKHSKLNGFTMLPDLREIKPVPVQQQKFFISVMPAKDIVTYPLRYFKRDLTNVGENKPNIGSNLSKDSSNLTFSLETLIENMIESNFVTNSVTNNSKIDETNKTISIETFTEAFNETNILLINATEENLDKNKYIDAINYTNIFNEFIATLSKKIESRNNTSMEILRKLTNGIVIADELSNEIYEKSTNAVETTISEPTSESNPVATTSTSVHSLSADLNSTDSQLEDPISNDYNEVKTAKERRQRFVRNLRRRRTN